MSNTKTVTNYGSTLNAQNCLCSKSDLHVFSVRKIVCFILIVPYSDLHVVSIHTAETDISPNSVTYPLEQYENLRTNIASALNTQENLVCLKSLSFDI